MTTLFERKRSPMQGVPMGKVKRSNDGRRATLVSVLLAKRNISRHSIWSSRRAGAAKMSHRPTIVSLHVEARILLTTVAGRSSMDRMAEGIEHMVIESVLSVAFVVIVGAAVVKAYVWYHDVLYGPYIKVGRLKQRPR
jgi:hypothetical protein